MNNMHDSCVDVRQALGMYYFGRLTELGLVIVERHLAVCQPCLDEYSNWGQLLEYLYTFKDLDADKLPEQLNDSGRPASP